MSAVLLGIGEREITPKPRHPIPLAGFAVRENKPFFGIDRKLWVRAWWFGQPPDAVLLVIADVLWWAPERERQFRERISREFDLPADHILLHATHTHSAPQTSFVFTESLGSPDPAWVNYFEFQTIAAIADSLSDIQPAILSRSSGTTQIGYNRRVAVDEPGASADAIGLVDPRLTVISATHPDGVPRGMLFHLACHPTTTSSPNVSSEFPGIACELLRDQFGVVSMLQGTCGDINPRLTRNRPERQFTDEAVEAIARTLVAEILTTEANQSTEISTLAIDVVTEVVDCLTAGVASKSDLAQAEANGGLDREWASALKRFPDRCVREQPLHIILARIAPNLSLLAFSAEVTTAFGLASRRIGGESVLPLGYTNGMTGYIVTDQQLANGGYESDESTKYFALPSRFAAGLEQRVLAGMSSVFYYEDKR